MSTVADRCTSASAAAEALVAELVEIDPSLEVRFGLPRADASRLPDLGPGGAERTAAAYRRALRRAHHDAAAEGDAIDRAMLGVQGAAELELLTHGDADLQLVAPFAPLGRLRSMLRPWPQHAHEQEQADARTLLLNKLPDALDDYRESLTAAIARGDVAGPLQGAEAIRSWRLQAAPGGLLDRAAPPGAIDAAAAARAALAGLVRWMESDYLPGTETDAVGGERYLRAWRRRTGATGDLREEYSWALGRHAELAEQQRRIAASLASDTPAGTLVRGLAAGEHADLGNVRLEGTEAVLGHLRGLIEQGLDYTEAVVAPLPEPLRELQARIGAPGGGSAAHYERPGRDGTSAATVLPHRDDAIWASWTLRSLWHHEGGPGHHVQLGGWTLAAAAIGSFRSTIGTIEAVTEGWAMYAETLADRHGRLHGVERLGYLDGQLLRAARVVVDIGLHVGAELGLRVPDGPYAGAAWTPDAAVELLGRHRAADPQVLEREVVRHLAWPAQAACYALGERSWWRLRAQAERRSGFRERDWHQRVLAMGSATFDALAAAG